MKKFILLLVAMLATTTVWAQNAPALGDLYYSDGTFSSTLIEGKTPIGVIAYLGSDSFSENGVTLRDGVTTLNSYGLVLCLKNAADNAQWGTVNDNEFGEDAAISFSDADNGLRRSTYVSGYTNTKTLIDKNASNYPAASATWNYTGLMAPNTTTGWFLPSIQQWVKILEGLGGMSESDVKYGVPFTSTPIDNLNTAMAKAGSSNYTGMTDNSVIYLSSTELAGYDNKYVVVLRAEAGNTTTYRFTSLLKNANSSAFPSRVRPVLAFSYEEDTPTGLIDIDAAQPKPGQRFNMMGQPVSNDYKGIVIEDGKKIIVR